MAARKTVTVVFCDIADSTPLGEALDPEVFRTVQQRYFDALSGALVHHGGTVEKYIGDAVMAVFGIPVAHDDDALRAVRAAIDMRTALAGLNDELEQQHGVRLSIRTGVNTGEVVAGDASAGHAFVSGVAVATTQRLEAAARAGEILLGDATYRLVSNAVLVEPIEALALKGKAEPVPAWRLLGVVEGAEPFPRRLDTPMVGREQELAALEAELEGAIGDRRCRLATILGPAGIGKSRLGNALFAAARGRATTLVGRCLPYGEGITYWPLRGVLLAAVGSLSRDAIEEFLGDAPEADAIAHRLAATVGEADAAAGGEETFWAVRRFFEQLARDEPLVVGIDELQWAEPTFLDLIEYLVGWTTDAPILVVGLSRPELMEVRPTWTSTSSLVLGLDPLSGHETERLVAALGGEALERRERRRILAAAEGNPLFVEQMLALAIDGADPDAIPPSIHALLAARLDRLDPDERAVLERAAVIGREFTSGAVAALSDGGAASPRLLSLVRRELIEPDRSLIPGDDGFRFRHILIRDAAYLALAKEARASLHEQYADWLERVAGELAEIVGYHLEQAFRYRQELGHADPDLAIRAGERLARAGRRAAVRSDLPAAVGLLTRAAALLPDSHPERREVLPKLGTALMRTGDFTRAERILDEALESVRASGDRRLELRTVIDREFVKVFTHPAESIDEIVPVADEAIPLLEELGDDLGLAKAWWLKSEAHVNACRWGARAENIERALEHAKRAGDVGEQATLSALLTQALHYGPTPVPEALRRCEELLDSLAEDRTLEAGVQSTIAALRAMEGDFDEARRLWNRVRTVYEELGLRARRAARSLIAAEIELLAGDADEAVSILRWGCDTLDELGMRSLRSTTAAFLADALATAGRSAEARRFADEASRDAAPADIVTQVMWRIARSRADGDPALAEEAHRLAETTDYPDLKARALVGLGDVAAARRIYEAKGNTAAVERLSAYAGSS